MAVTRETFEELIDDVREVRDQVAAQLREVQAHADLLRRRLDELEKEEDGYRLTLARRFPNDPMARSELEDLRTTELRQAAPQSIESMPRTDAVLRVVQELTQGSRPVGPGDIESALRAMGRDDDRNQIGGALAYLNRTGQVHSVGRARWLPGSAEDGGAHIAADE